MVENCAVKLKKKKLESIARAFTCHHQIVNELYIYIGLGMEMIICLKGKGYILVQGGITMLIKTQISCALTSCRPHAKIPNIANAKWIRFCDRDDQ